MTQETFTITEIDETGNALERVMTDEEIALKLADKEIIAKIILAKTTLEALKASARAKLVAGQPLTEEEAATLVI